MATVDTEPGQVFRSGSARFFGWVWVVFAAANMIDLAVRGRDAQSLVAAAVLLLGTGIAYVVGFRPRIVAEEEGVRMRNLFRDAWVPWGAVERVEGRDAVRVHCSGRDDPVKAWVLQSSPRARAKFEMKARREEKRLSKTMAEAVKGRTPTDFAVEQLTEAAKDHKRRHRGQEPGDPAVTWSWPAIAALAVPAVLTLVAILVAAL